MKRREFLKSSIATSALLSLSAVAAKAAAAKSDAAAPNRQYYELRVYRLKSAEAQNLLDSYLEKAAIPAWNRSGATPIGAFTEIDSKDAPAVYVVIPYPSIEVFISAGAHLESDAEYQKAGAEYLGSPKSNPAFDRIDSWLLAAFTGMPRLELPAYSKEKKARMFEMRTYESFSEVKALKKIEMFNSGEIATMKEVGLAPVFYGQALIGANLPHLTYMTSAENDQAHKQHWDAFGKHPVWLKLKNDPQYADTVSKITKRFLKPTAYSQI
jgi:hypothetical protein